ISEYLVLLFDILKNEVLGRPVELVKYLGHGFNAADLPPPGVTLQLGLQHVLQFSQDRRRYLIKACDSQSNINFYMLRKLPQHFSSLVGFKIRDNYCDRLGMLP